MQLFGISSFDVFFFIFVVVCEVHWYLEGKKDDKRLKEIEDQLLEANQRLEIALEKNENIPFSE